MHALVILSDGKTHLAMQAEHKKCTIGLHTNRCQCYVCQSEQEEKYKSDRECQYLWLAFLENVCNRALMVVETQLRSRCKAQLAHSFHNASVPVTALAGGIYVFRLSAPLSIPFS